MCLSKKNPHRIFETKGTSQKSQKAKYFQNSPRNEKLTFLALCFSKKIRIYLTAINSKRHLILSQKKTC